MMTTQLWLKITILTFGSLLWFEIYWIQFIALTIIIYWMLSVIDTILWARIAIVNKTTSSNDLKNGMIVKWIMWLLILFSTLMVGILNYVTDNNKIELALSVWVAILNLWFSWTQALSIIENLAILSKNKREKILLNKILKIAGIGEEKLNKKLEKYIWDM